MTLVVARYGDDAFGALADEIASSQRDDPLRRVTVVVPRGQVALATRRRLAAHPPGVLNVSFLTISKLAAELAAGWPAVSGRRPATPAVVAGAVRSALAGPEAGPLAPVADQPATARALTRTYRDLRWAAPEAVDALSARVGRAGAAARAVADVGRRLRSFYDDVDLVAAACDVVRGGGPETGPVVVYLPARLRSVDLDLLKALEAAVRVTVIVGATGDDEADGPASATSSSPLAAGRRTTGPSRAGSSGATRSSAPRPPMPRCSWPFATSWRAMPTVSRSSGWRSPTTEPPRTRASSTTS